MCLHALSSFQRTDRPCARGAQRLRRSHRHCSAVAVGRPRLGEPSKVTRTDLDPVNPKIAAAITTTELLRLKVTPELGNCCPQNPRQSLPTAVPNVQRVSCVHGRGPSSQPDHDDSASAPFRSTNSRPPIACVARQPRLRIRHRAGCSRTRRPTAPAAAPRSSTARAARAPRDRPSPMPVARELRSPAAPSTAHRRTPPARRRRRASRCPRRTARVDACSARATCSAPCTSVVTSRASTRCASRFSGARRRRRLERRRSPSRSRNVKNFRYAHDVAIVGVQPELIELERRGPRRIEPDRARFGLAELRARRRRHQRQTSPCAFCARSLRIRSMPAVMLPH